MKLNLGCPHCIWEEIQAEKTGPKKGLPLQNLEISSYHINNDGLYTHICAKNHITYYALKNELYELLFESGMYAIRDGYFR